MEQPGLNSSEQPFKDDREKENLSSNQSLKLKTERMQLRSEHRNGINSIWGQA